MELDARDIQELFERGIITLEEARAILRHSNGSAARALAEPVVCGCTCGKRA